MFFIRLKINKYISVKEQSTKSSEYLHTWKNLEFLNYISPVQGTSKSLYVYSTGMIKNTVYYIALKN